MEHFWINHNSFSGTLPDEIYTLDNLIKLKVNNNLFEGNISSNIANLSNLEVVDFSYNNLEGIIPESICSLNVEFGGYWSDKYYLYDINNFGITNNYLCPNIEAPFYPVCIQDYIGTQTYDVNCND